MDTSIFRANESSATRLHIESEHPLRSKFQRDRDRILYSKEFRRLSGKTQVFVAGFDDHMRTRLTHTLEVSQIADTIARALNVNEVLVEAIAYGHDVGHTPFGHVGERTLNSIMNGCRNIYGYNMNLDHNQRGFKHNWQGLRVVTELEQIKDDYKGLNLTRYTLWGILNHSGVTPKPCKEFRTINEQDKCKMTNSEKQCLINGNHSFGFYDHLNVMMVDSRDWTFESGIVATADEIAQRHHDIEDALYAGIIKIDEICDQFQSAFSNFLNAGDLTELKDIKDNSNSKFVVSLLNKMIVNFYTTHYIDQLRNKMINIKEKFGVESNKEFYFYKESIYEHLLAEFDNKNVIDTIQFDNHVIAKNDNFYECDRKFQKFLSGVILQSELAQSMDGKSDFIIRQLFKAYLSNPQQLPDSTISKAYESLWDAISTCKTDSLRKIKPYDARVKVENFLKEENDEINAIVLRTVCDFIAGMTDQFAMDQFDRLYGTQKFKSF